MSEIKRALISVSDKSGIVKLAKKLEENNIEIISTGGTAKKLNNNGVKVTNISEVTNFPEMMDGRVKTLHPNIHGGILARRNNESDIIELENLNIKTIDLVICNLYPFAETVDKDVDLKTALENIDIGGPTMIRSAAKNFLDVLVIVDPKDYDELEKKLNTKVDIDLNFKKKMAYKAFNHTAEYDSIIQEYFYNTMENKNDLPKVLIKPYYKKSNLRYGENPHQKAAFYKDRITKESSISNAVKIKGDKELSFNNINDTNGAIELVKEFHNKPTAAVIKHTNPCGLGSAEDILTAFKKAYAGDPLSAFGSIVILNREVDQKLAEEIIKGDKYIEVVAAPSYTDKAVDILYNRWNNLRILKTGDLNYKNIDSYQDTKKVTGGLLVQNRDLKTIDKNDLKLVTETKVSDKELDDLLFAFKAVKHVKSNAIVIVKDEMILGVGAGQMSRVDSMIIAGRKANGRNKGAVVASDAFFPFPDAIEKAAELNIKAIIQPGGSIRDKEVISKANELHIAMYFTDIRHFCH